MNPAQNFLIDPAATTVQRGAREAWVAVRLLMVGRPASAAVEAQTALQELGRLQGFMVHSTTTSDLVLHLLTKEASELTPSFLRGLGKLALDEVKGQMWIGFGTPREAREAISGSSREAQETVEVARRIWTMPKAVVFTDVLPFLALTSDRARCLSLAKVLTPIEKYDRRRRGKLVATLERTVEHHWSVAATARTLELHRHTVEYRLKKVQHILGLELLEGTDRFLIESAIAARRLLQTRV